MGINVNSVNWDFLLRLQKDSFQYFVDLANPNNGLIPDTDNKESSASIAGMGFALSCYPIAIEKKFMSRSEVIDRILVVLNFFADSEQSDNENATGYKGFYYHFLDMKTGLRAGGCELSFVDTGFLLAGILCVATYFQGTDPVEKKIRSLADYLYRRVDWQWAICEKLSLSQGWTPSSGFIHYAWEGYNEALLLYTLGLGSPTFPLAEKSFAVWTSTYQWENIYDVDFLYAGPLFIHMYSHAWIDFRGIRDKFMREKKIDYFENSRRALKVQQIYCDRNPNNFKGYEKNCWGITADLGPDYQKQIINGKPITFYSYAARGVPYGPDDGTIAPWATLASLCFDETIGISAINHLRVNYPQILGKYGFKCSFNDSIVPPWFPERFYALDLGISILMLENAQNNFTWNLMKKCPVISNGLRRAGFRGGWL
ncbi:MAG: glucoamylase family protein [Bacteriovorax sp.]|nr:glucoamylase family protein [Bacteriovorax sp.]